MDGNRNLWDIFQSSRKPLIQLVGFKCKAQLAARDHNIT
jgi:hypothetical protein